MSRLKEKISYAVKKNFNNSVKKLLSYIIYMRLVYLKIKGLKNNKLSL
jgi:hypothetical protein